jgi:hypothetical protein
VPSGKWFSTFRSIVVSLFLSGRFIGCWTLENANTQGFSETSGTTCPAEYGHIPEDMVPFITSVMPSDYRM